MYSLKEVKCNTTFEIASRHNTNHLIAYDLYIINLGRNLRIPTLSWHYSCNQTTNSFFSIAWNEYDISGATLLDMSLSAHLCQAGIGTNTREIISWTKSTVNKFKHKARCVIVIPNSNACQNEFISNPR